MFIIYVLLETKALLVLIGCVRINSYGVKHLILTQFMSYAL